jgi:hypothetical protein
MMRAIGIAISRGFLPICADRLQLSFGVRWHHELLADKACRIAESGPSSPSAPVSPTGYLQACEK